jgi:monolysocardiolipin acyltransferase
MFTKPWQAKFFELGQVINTERGGGIFQPAIDRAVKLVQDGEWVCGSKSLRIMLDNVNLTDPYISRGKGQPAKVQSRGRVDTVQVGSVNLPILKFRPRTDYSGRIIMDSEVMPEIIPMWISGKPSTHSLPIHLPRMLTDPPHNHR